MDDFEAVLVIIFIISFTAYCIISAICTHCYKKLSSETAKQFYYDAIRRKQQELDQEFAQKRNRYQYELRTWIREPIQSCPHLAKMISDYVYLLDLEDAEYLRHKQRPALKGAERVDQLSKEKRVLMKQVKELEYKVSIYESMFPDLQEYAENNTATEDDDDVVNEDEDKKRDPIHDWLSDDEYDSLSPTERNTLALERYKKRNKSKKEIGREYERYIGYLYESKGYKVEYFGILKGLNDMGRDLICTKGNTTVIIQCKCWSKDKVIHEKHINQLYGSLTEYKIQHRDSTRRRYKAAFYTTTQLSDMALAFADALKIEVVHEELGDFPMVKCNIGRKNMEKIYHLPFDQNYDKVRIEPERGESFAWTVEEAEEKGFRHAHKWIAEYGD